MRGLAPGPGVIISERGDDDVRVGYVNDPRASHARDPRLDGTTPLDIVSNTVRFHVPIPNSEERLPAAPRGLGR